MTDRNDFALLMMTRSVPQASNLTSAVKAGVPFEAWTTWTMLGFNSRQELGVTDFAFTGEGFDIALTPDDFEIGDVVVRVISTGAEVTVQMLPEDFDAFASRIERTDLTCDEDAEEVGEYRDGSERCACGDYVVPVTLELVDDLPLPRSPYVAEPKRRKGLRRSRGDAA